MTDNNKKRSTSRKGRKRVHYVLKKKKRPEPILKETFTIDIKQLVKENVHSSTRTSDFHGRYITCEDEFETEYNKFFKRKCRSTKSNRISNYNTIRTPSPKRVDYKSSVSPSCNRRSTDSIFGTFKTMSPDSEVKIYKSNLKYSSIWDLIQIFEKRKKLFSKPKPKTRITQTKMLKKSIQIISKKASVYEERKEMKNLTAEYFNSKKDVSI
jgi:hypothetical protein